MERDKVLSRMMKLCSMREYCKDDIRRKIVAMDVPGVDADDLLSVLCREKFIDEARYAEAFAKDRMLLQGWGEQKIRCALYRKGIPAGIVSDALASVDKETAFDRMVSLLDNKYRTLKGSEEDKFAKLYRFAVGRGFTYDKIRTAYDRIRSDKRD